MNNIHIDDFCNSYTLNIFSDASTANYKNTTIGCYGVAVVNKNDILETCYRVVSDTTSNNCEIKGLRKAVSLANKWKCQFKRINIFCDSLLSINGLKQYIFNWRFNPEDNLLYSSSNKVAANQSIFIETLNMLQELCFGTDVQVFLYYQPGHVGTTFNSILQATESFRKNNNLFCKIDYNFIRYISTYNNYVDNTSRTELRKSNFEIERVDPIEFYAKGKIKRFLE